MSGTETAITIALDPSNPGQFFACCGLLELAGRLWGDTEGWFGEKSFSIQSVSASQNGELTLSYFLLTISRASIVQLDDQDGTSSPIGFKLHPLNPVDAPPMSELRLDWWKDTHTAGRQLKVWAGSMGVVRIAQAMHGMLANPGLQSARLLDYSAVVFHPEEQDKKVEPFYFDSRRGANALPIDVGFSPDSLGMSSAAYPAVEFLCLVGLQRFRPLATDTRRQYDYFTWALPLPLSVASAASSGLIPVLERRRFRFRVTFRTDQKKHKAFAPATQLEGE